jgi:hypothetical protein
MVDPEGVSRPLWVVIGAGLLSLLAHGVGGPLGGQPLPSAFLGHFAPCFMIQGHVRM